MRVGEGHALGGEAIDVGRWDFAIGVEGLDVAVAQVVRHDKNDVRGPGVLGPGVGGGGEWCDEERAGEDEQTGD